MNHYPLSPEQATDKRAIRNLVEAIFDDYGDGLSSHKTLSGVEMIMNCVVGPLMTAEPSGNTGELPVCAACRDAKQLYRETDYGGRWVPCPDCNPAKESK